MSNKTNEAKEIYYPTNDYCFKRLFGHRGNEKITQNLLEAILEKKCEVIKVKADEITEKDLATEKVGILDVYVQEKDGTQINIEMQVLQYEEIIERLLFYWAQKYTESIKAGESYNKLKPTKVILIANFEINRLKSIKEIATSFEILDRSTGKIILTKDLEIVIIELPKLKKYKTSNTELENWLKFIINPNEVGGDILEKNEAMKRAKEVYDELMADEHEKSLIKLREKYIRDYNTIKEGSYAQGLESGRAERNIEIAKKMIKKGMSKEDIQEITGLSEKEIDKIEKED